MENFDVARNALNTSLEAEGSASIEHSKWLESIEAKTKQLEASWQDLSQTVLDSSLIKGTIDFGTGFLDFLTNAVDKIGLFIPLMTTLGGSLSAFKDFGIFSKDITGDLNSLITGVSEASDKFGIFGRSFADLKDALSVKGGFKNALSVGLTDMDINMLNNYNAEIERGTPVTEALANTMKGASKSAVEMAQSAKGATVNLTGVTTTANTSRVAMIGLRVATVALNAALSMGIAFAIQGIITGLSNLVHASKNASEAADELKSEFMEKANSAKEEVSTIDELIDKYKELKNSDVQDSGTRSEILDIQNQIASAVGSQADELDLINGKLDEELSKLQDIKNQSVKGAVETATAAYSAAKDAANKAIGTESDMWADGFEYIGEVTDEEKSTLGDYFKLFSGKGTVTTLSGDYKLNLTNLREDVHWGSPSAVNDFLESLNADIDTAQGKVAILDEMISRIESTSGYVDSKLYKGLVKERDTYQAYVDDEIKTTNAMIDMKITEATANKNVAKMQVDSVESYGEYRNKLVKLVKESPEIKNALEEGFITESDVSRKIDDYLGTLPQYSDYYEQFTKLEQQQKKFENIKKSFADLNQGSFFEQARFNKWFDKLSDEDKEIVYKISLDEKSAEYSLKDWENALKSYSDVDSQTAESIENAFSSAKEKSENIITDLSSVQTILSSQKAGKSISIEDYNSGVLNDYRSALEYVNGTMQINVEKANEIAKAKTNEQIALNDTDKAMAQSKYLENAKKIEKYRKQLKDLSSADEQQRKGIQGNIEYLLSQNNAISETCKQYDLLSLSLQEATSAYQHWLNSQSSADYGDMANDAVSAIQFIRDEYSKGIYGDYGTGKFSAAIDFIIPETVDSYDLEAINSYMSDFKQYLRLDSDGKIDGLNFEKFLSNSVEAGLMSYSEDDGFKVLAGKKMEDFAEGLNLSSGVVQAFFDEIESKTREKSFDWSDEVVKTVGDLAVEANQAAESLRNVEKYGDLKIKMDVSDIEGKENQIKALDDTIEEMSKLKLKPNVDSSDIDKANAVIQYCLKQKQLLSVPDVMRVDTSQVTGEISEAISLLQEFQNAQNNLEIISQVGADTAEAEAEVDALASKISALSPTIKSELEIDSTSVDSIQQSINNLTVEKIVSLKVNPEAIEGYNPESKDCDVIYNPVTDNLVEKFKPVSRDVNYKAITAGLPTSFTKLTRYVEYVKTGDHELVGSANTKTKFFSGTHSLNGSAKANGDWRVTKGGKTLVGELGRKYFATIYRNIYVKFYLIAGKP